MSKYKVLNEKYINTVIEPIGNNTDVIQYIIEYKGVYGIASTKPLTVEEVSKIDLNKYKFVPLNEVLNWQKKKRRAEKRKPLQI